MISIMLHDNQKYRMHVSHFQNSVETNYHFQILQYVCIVSDCLASFCGCCTYSDCTYSDTIGTLFCVIFRGLSPYSFGILFHHHFLVPARVPGLVSLLFILFHHHFLAPSSSRKGCGACLPSVVALCSIMTSSFLLVPARVPGFVSLLFFPFSGRGLCSIVLFWLLLVPGSGSGACPPSFLSFLFSGMGHPMNSLLRKNVVETWFVAVWGLCWCNFVLS